MRLRKLCLWKRLIMGGDNETHELEINIRGKKEELEDMQTEIIKALKMINSV